MEVSQRISVSGLRAFQRQLDVVSNNIANQSTTGFKRSHANLSDIGYQAGITAPVGPGGANVRIDGIGEGVQVADVSHEFLPGAIQPTDSPLDVALSGDGFMTLTLPDGQLGYTRDGSLHLDAAGRLVNSDGLPLRSADGGDLVIPQDASAARVDGQGQLVVQVGDAQQVVGRLAFARFRNNEGLVAAGRNVFAASDASGPAADVVPGDATGLSVVSGALEGSNVDLGDEFTRLIQAQRGYQLNLKVVQAWDEVTQMANQIRR